MLKRCLLKLDNNKLAPACPVVQYHFISAYPIVLAGRCVLARS